MEINFTTPQLRAVMEVSVGFKILLILCSTSAANHNTYICLDTTKKKKKKSDMTKISRGEMSKEAVSLSIHPF